jgi:hypothetical protein
VESSRIAAGPRQLATETVDGARSRATVILVLTLTLARTPPSSLCYLIKINETVHGVSLVHRDAHLMPVLERPMWGGGVMLTSVSGA